MEAWVSRARAQEVQKRWGIADVPVVDMVKDVRACGDVSCVLVGADGSRYREVDTNVWMRDGEAVDAVWVNTGKHGGGITLRPLYVPVEGEWVNVATGRPAPGELRLPAPSASKSAPSETPSPLSFDASWRNKCEGLVRICEASTWAVDSGAVYQRMIDMVADVLQCDQAHMSLLAADGESFVGCARHFGEGDRVPVSYPEVRPITMGRFYLLKRAEIIVMDFANPHREDEIPEANREAGYCWGVTFPLMSEGSVCGACTALFKTELDYDEERDGPFLLAVGRVLGSLVARVQATRKSMDLEILCDRRRLGDEIASSVASLASNLSVGVDSVLESYEKGDDAAVRANLERLGEVSRRVIGAMRDELTSLRVPLDRTDGLVSALKETLDRFQSQWGVETALDIHADGGAVVVPLQVSLQIVRILSECLSNVLRHAEATRVTVSLEEGDRLLSLAVEDNGRGFDVQAVPPERMGLRVMRERAESMGGRLSVMSGKTGTTICVDVPRIAAL